MSVVDEMRKDIRTEESPCSSVGPAEAEEPVVWPKPDAWLGCDDLQKRSRIELGAGPSSPVTESWRLVMLRELQISREPPHKLKLLGEQLFTKGRWVFVTVTHVYQFVTHILNISSCICNPMEEKDGAISVW
jgi:hypothetical protein